MEQLGLSSGNNFVLAMTSLERIRLQKAAEDVEKKNKARQKTEEKEAGRPL